jgi:hypothetical protein
MDQDSCPMDGRGQTRLNMTGVLSLTGTTDQGLKLYPFAKADGLLHSRHVSLSTMPHTPPFVFLDRSAHLDDVHDIYN